MAQEEKWEDAWNSYMAAIADPWNAFLDTAEDLTVEDILLDANTDVEVLTWVSNNIFVEGASLGEVIPELNGAIDAVAA